GQFHNAFPVHFVWPKFLVKGVYKPKEYRINQQVSQEAHQKRSDKGDILQNGIGNACPGFPKGRDADQKSVQKFIGHWSRHSPRFVGNKKQPPHKEEGEDLSDPYSPSLVFVVMRPAKVSN